MPITQKTTEIPAAPEVVAMSKKALRLRVAQVRALLKAKHPEFRDVRITVYKNETTGLWETMRIVLDVKS